MFVVTDFLYHSEQSLFYEQKIHEMAKFSLYANLFLLFRKLFSKELLSNVQIVFVT